MAQALHPIFLLLGVAALGLLACALALPARLRPDNHPAPAPAQRTAAAGSKAG
jgi:hypothetical protein